VKRVISGKPNSETGVVTVSDSPVTHRSVTPRVSAAYRTLPVRAAVRHVQPGDGQCTQECIPGHTYHGVYPDIPTMVYTGTYTPWVYWSSLPPWVY